MFECIYPCDARIAAARITAVEEGELIVCNPLTYKLISNTNCNPLCSVNMKGNEGRQCKCYFIFVCYNAFELIICNMYEHCMAHY